MTVPKGVSEYQLQLGFSVEKNESNRKTILWTPLVP